MPSIFSIGWPDRADTLCQYNWLDGNCIGSVFFYLPYEFSIPNFINKYGNGGVYIAFLRPDRSYGIKSYYNENTFDSYNEQCSSSNKYVYMSRLTQLDEFNLRFLYLYTIRGGECNQPYQGNFQLYDPQDGVRKMLIFEFYDFYKVPCYMINSILYIEFRSKFDKLEVFNYSNV